MLHFSGYYVSVSRPHPASHRNACNRSSAVTSQLMVLSRMLRRECHLVVVVYPVPAFRQPTFSMRNGNGTFPQSGTLDATVHGHRHVWRLPVSCVPAGAAEHTYGRHESCCVCRFSSIAAVVWAQTTKGARTKLCHDTRRSGSVVQAAVTRVGAEEIVDNNVHFAHARFPATMFPGWCSVFLLLMLLLLQSHEKHSSEVLLVEGPHILPVMVVRSSARKQSTKISTYVNENT